MANKSEIMEILQGIADADQMVAEVTRPKANEALRKFTVGCRAYLQGSIVYNNIRIDMDGRDFAIDNPIKSKVIR